MQVSETCLNSISLKSLLLHTHIHSDGDDLKSKHETNIMGCTLAPAPC